VPTHDQPSWLAGQPTGRSRSAAWLGIRRHFGLSPRSDTMQPENRDEERLIRQLLDDYSDAISVRAAQAAHEHYSDELVCFDLAPPLALAGEAALDTKPIQTWMDSWSGPIQNDVRDLRIVVGGDVALAYGLRHMTGTKKGGEKVDLWFRATCGLRKEKGEWKIVHLHNSVPFYMDGSERAATDLVP
jgi:ketosteroid isomerase-like protein